MKRIISIIVLLVTVSVTYAGNGSKTVAVRDVEMTRSNGFVNVTFNVDVGSNATKSRYNLIVKPVLKKDGNRHEMPQIVVHGRRAKVADKRHVTASGIDPYAPGTVFTSNGETITYKASFPDLTWMRGSDLILEAVSAGCCSAKQVPMGLIAQNVLHAEPDTEQMYTTIPSVKKDLTTGDRLARVYPFIEPITSYKMPIDFANQTIAEAYVDQNRENSLSIYFRQGRRVIEHDLMNNRQTLNELIFSLQELMISGDSKIVRILIAGFASPEGTYEFNDRLAWDRAVALKELILKNVRLDPRSIALYNGAIDWGGLRTSVVESDMYERNSIVNIIDNVPIWDSHRNIGRKSELMKLNGGDSWKYMLRNFFPTLRQAAYIKVYYENK